MVRPPCVVAASLRLLLSLFAIQNFFSASSPICCTAFSTTALILSTSYSRQSQVFSSTGTSAYLVVGQRKISGKVARYSYCMTRLQYPHTQNPLKTVLLGRFRLFFLFLFSFIILHRSNARSNSSSVISLWGLPPLWSLTVADNCQIIISIGVQSHCTDIASVRGVAAHRDISKRNLCIICLSQIIF